MFKTKYRYKMDQDKTYALQMRRWWNPFWKHMRWYNNKDDMIAAIELHRKGWTHVQN